MNKIKPNTNDPSPHKTKKSTKKTIKKIMQCNYAFLIDNYVVMYIVVILAQLHHSMDPSKSIITYIC